jgi:hypothetical protein
MRSWLRKTYFFKHVANENQHKFFACLYDIFSFTYSKNPFSNPLYFSDSKAVILNPEHTFRNLMTLKDHIALQ